MRKSALNDLIEANRPKEKYYRVEKLLERYGHQVIRLPPYMCEFNAIELAWAKVKRSVRENNTAGQLSLHALQMQTAETMSSCLLLQLRTGMAIVDTL
jgi:hypothetical protein